MKEFEIYTSKYNARRFSRPWVAVVTFRRTGKASYNWGRWLGEVSNGIGSDGVLVIVANDGDIIAVGQKDHRGNNTPTTWYQVRDGMLVKLDGGKTEAFRLTIG